MIVLDITCGNEAGVLRSNQIERARVDPMEFSFGRIEVDDRRDKRIGDEPS